MMVQWLSRTYRDLRYARFSRALVEVLPEGSMNQLTSPMGSTARFQICIDTFVVADGKFGIRDRLFPCHYEDRAANPTLRETDPHANILPQVMVDRFRRSKTVLMVSSPFTEDRKAN